MPPDMAADVQVKNRENVKITPTVQSSSTVQSSAVHNLYYAYLNMSPGHFLTI
jgi:hypothetical protein